MMDDRNYTNRNVIIRDSNNNHVSQTVIKEHNKKEMWITVYDIPNELKSEDPITLLIITDNGLHEYNGNIIKDPLKRNTYVKIGLFKGRVIENRKAVRYAVDLTGEVSHLFYKNKPAKLLHSMKVNVGNISATGIMIRSNNNSFRYSCILELAMNMGEETSTVIAKVVRIKNINNGISEYGCKFVSIN